MSDYGLFEVDDLYPRCGTCRWYVYGKKAEVPACSDGRCTNPRMPWQVITTGLWEWCCQCRAHGLQLHEWKEQA